MRRLNVLGSPVENVNTGKECHLDAHLTEHALEDLPLSELDVVFIENVGNLVCPADFPLGADKRVVVISVTEGDDMVRKHPMIFRESDVIVINKADLAPMAAGAAPRPFLGAAITTALPSRSSSFLMRSWSAWSSAVISSSEAGMDATMTTRSLPRASSDRF
jgi:putative protein kinase ArgK-like GTPase of G3E family